MDDTLKRILISIRYFPRYLLTLWFFFHLSPKPVFALNSPSFEEFDQKAKAGERLNVVFFGSSLTWGTNATDPQLTSYRGLICHKLEEYYPKAHFKFWDVSIGGTGSQLGIFRLDRDVLSRKPDLVFLDFSANDDPGTAHPGTQASYEAIVHRLVKEAKCPVIAVIFPFQWHVTGGKLESLKGRTANLAIANAYHLGVGDVILYARKQVNAKKIKAEEIWPFDRIHPGDVGYRLFSEAVWQGFQQAVKEKKVCALPKKMLYPDTYLRTSRVPMTSLASRPKGWRSGLPKRTSAYFHMQMSRWMDDVLLTTNLLETADANGKGKKILQSVDRLRIQFKGTTVLLFGESTEKSCKYRVYLNGKALTRTISKEKDPVKEFDASWLAYLMRSNSHLVHVLAEGLDPKATHTLEIEPVFSSKMVMQELRLESLCVAGGEAKVLNVKK